jgi:protein-disulfide isomerase
MLALSSENLWGKENPPLKSASAKVENKAELFENDDSFEENLKKISIPNEFMLKEVVVGSETAPNTVIIYSSFTCSHCREFHSKEFPKFKQKYVDSGKVKVYLRSYLDDRGALESSTLVRCFGGDSNEKIENLYRKVFQRQKEWLASPDPKQFLRDVFKKLGYDPKEIEGCIANTKISAGLMKEQQRAMHELKISLIPAFIVNGKIHMGKRTCQELADLLKDRPQQTSENSILRD